MAGREGRRRRRKAGPGKGGEGKGTRRSCGSSRDGGAVLAAAPVRRETHSNRPLAMTQQHAVPLQHWRRRGAERRGGAWRVEKPERWEGSRERRRRARRRARRVGSRPLRHYRWAPAHCTTRGARGPRGPGPAQPGRRWRGDLVLLWLFKRSVFPCYETVGPYKPGIFVVNIAGGRAESPCATPQIDLPTY